MQTESQKPAELGYRMPAEWEPHEATWLTWPRPEGISFPGAFEEASAVWARLASVLSDFEAVHINFFDPAHEEVIRKALEKSGAADRVEKKIHLHNFPAYEPWVRDHGPIFVVRDTPQGRDLAVVDWGYNAWGGKYPPHDLDDAVPRHVAGLLGLPLFPSATVMEGGSLDVNGRGDLLTTTSCLLNPNRNPHLSREQIEQELRDYLGVERIHWLGEGIAGDDTDGHVDDISRFTSHDTIATVIEDDPADPNYAPLMENYERLLGLRDGGGRPFRVVTLPMPPRIEREGQRLPASYANFYIANGVVIVPVFQESSDREALATLGELFPGRKIYALDARDLIWGLGAAHCITQQQPAVKIARY